MEVKMKMRNIKPKAKYQGISFPEEFITEVKNFVVNNPKYKSVADFSREAIREKMERERKTEPSPIIPQDEIKRLVNSYLFELTKKK